MFLKAYSSSVLYTNQCIEYECGYSEGRDYNRRPQVIATKIKTRQSMYVRT